MALSSNLLYAITCQAGGGYKHGKNLIKGFSELTVVIPFVYCTKEIASAYVKVYDKADQTTYTTQGIAPSKIVKAGYSDGYYLYKSITLEDVPYPPITGTVVAQLYASTADITYYGSTCEINVEEPIWEQDILVSAPPPLVLNGRGMIDQLKVYKWDDDLEDWSGYDTFKSPIQISETSSNSWKFKYSFLEKYVSKTGGDLTDEPDVKLDLTYKYYDNEEKAYRRAFFSTTRNQNYSNGIYNVMFVSGVVGNPSFTSRAWWSQINNPLYFPDTNYSEIGSNDTAIMGLTKVGDYLCAVKQSKTTDTAIYLLYPTSFEEQTTYAVKQGVQGVGALARYSFNILGDETLFLSPRGVMAVVPSGDDDHKVLNRSYFVDKRLLAEDNIENAFSFVYDGKYFLTMGDGTVYVLDGNQRNSWGNDRTNLVYECYYLRNVPAKSFVKFRDRLAFTDGSNVCAFNDGYTDAYSDLGEGTPVSAEWSTILDDDGAIHYYKTMQKKGNLVSILPKENEVPYKMVTVTENEFNANKTLYFTFNGKKYVRCAEDSTYSADAVYYVENRSSTRVYIKRDDKAEVEIKRKFGLSSDIPSELYLNKKFKKYKRLQFIVRNEAAEAFGVDSIVKNYSIGNYAKK